MLQTEEPGVYSGGLVRVLLTRDELVTFIQIVKSCIQERGEGVLSAAPPSVQFREGFLAYLLKQEEEVVWEDEDETGNSVAGPPSSSWSGNGYLHVPKESLL